jgi:hypothetical protein
MKRERENCMLEEKNATTECERSQSCVLDVAAAHLALLGLGRITIPF